MVGDTGWGWVLPAGLVLAWIALLIWRRRARPLFFVTTFVLVLAAVVLGFGAIAAVPDAPSNEAGIPLAGIPNLTFVAFDNALAGFGCWLGLLVLTVLWTLIRAPIGAVRTGARRARRGRRLGS